MSEHFKHLARDHTLNILTCIRCLTVNLYYWLDQMITFLGWIVNIMIRSDYDYDCDNEMQV